MKNKVKVAFMMFALLIGLSVTASAQVIRRTRNGRTVVVVRNNRRVYRNPYYWQNRRARGARTYRLPNGRLVTILPNGRRIYH
ncbi:MAG: hypothetical protein WCB68_07800 [Pyrinomonadaceae bacterium]